MDNQQLVVQLISKPQQQASQVIARITSSSEKVIIDPKLVVPLLTDPNTVAKIIKRHFGIQLRPLDRPIYRKLYKKWVDKMIPLLKRFETPNLTIFSMKDRKSTMEQFN